MGYVEAMADISTRRPGFFFDRDGTVNKSPGHGYVLSWRDFHLIPGAREMLAAVREAGWKPILVTSQQGVGKRLMSQADLDEIHARMQQELGDAAFEGIYVATGLEGADPRRKPAPAMLLEAATEHHLDLTRSWNVGDTERDMEMGRRAGVPHNLLFGSQLWPDWPAVMNYWRALTANEPR
jgi:D-glycero-D-manno-heptose 1,7-bisphosphate phosphatase